jgi:hypothetical protein
MEVLNNFKLLLPNPVIKVSFCSNTGPIRDDPYWTSIENIVDLIELSNTNKVSF